MSARTPRIAGHDEHDWALVLGAGEGKRLRSLTTDASGTAVPKQFCSLSGHQSLLHDTLVRARNVASPAHTCVVVAAAHERWWRLALHRLPGENVIVQPRNRGTAIGILLPLLSILRRDPQATLLVLPSDHFVRDEPILARAIRAAMARARQGEVVLLGIDPEEADPELGYIVPDAPCGDEARHVHTFVEKPEAARARDVIANGGLWNSFIFAAQASTLLAMFQRLLPQVVTELAAVERRTASSQELADLYSRLPDVDFSRDVLQRFPQSLRVLRVPACGWSDLGTPRRLTDVLRRERPHVPASVVAASSVLNLADQYARLRTV